jgi:hypothetical protein
MKRKMLTAMAVVGVAMVGVTKLEMSSLRIKVMAAKCVGRSGQVHYC